MSARPLLRITTTRRVYINGYRVHHGLAGVALIAIGAALTHHDRRDWPWPLRDPAGDL